MSNWDPTMGGSPPPGGPPSGPPPGPPTGPSGPAPGPPPGPSGPPPGPTGGGYGGPPAGYGGPPAGYGGPPAGYGGPPAGAAPPGYGAPPPGYGGTPPGYPPPRKSAAPWVILGIGVTLVLAIIVGAVVVFVIAADDASADEVFLETSTAPGPAPFTDSVAKNVVNTGTTSTSAAPPPTTAGASTGGVASTSGGEPGLYGGTKDIASCDAEKLIVFLETNPDKGRAWAGVLGISYTDIRSYVKKLTSVVLRNDVRVTNHGWENGRATTFQAVLQAGTAVLVDSYGRPIVKCYCGNPLTSPTPVKQVRYTGTRWVGFSPATIIVIQPTTVIIDTFTLTDPYGERFRRPAGTDGGQDGSGAPASTTTSSPPTTGSPPTTDSPTTTEPPPTVVITEPPVITAPPGNPAQGAWQIEGYYEINRGGVTGKSSWYAALQVAADGSISGSGDGQATGSGGCFSLDTGAQISTYNATINYTVSVTGRLSGNTMQLTVTAGAINLDSLVYTPPNVSENDGCRRDAQNGYRTYVTDQMSSFSIAAENGAFAPVGAATKGTVNLSRV